MKNNTLKILSVFLTIVLMSTLFFGCDYENYNEPTTPTHICRYNKKITTENYKSKDATCKRIAEYYYSCECGEKGNTKFYYGSTVEHNYQSGKCIWCGKEKTLPTTPTTPTNPTTPTTPTTPSNPSQNEDTSRLVYVTPTGKRYHYSKSCAGKNATESTKNKAEKIGLTGCKNCT